MILDNLLIYMQQNAQQATPIFPTGIIVGVPRCRYSIITVRLDWPANIIRTLNKEEIMEVAYMAAYQAGKGSIAFTADALTAAFQAAATVEATK